MTTRFAHVTLATRDVERSRDFFSRTLGWKTVPHAENILRDAAWLAIAPGQELHLLRVDDFAPSPFEKEFGRHVAICAPLAEFEALRERLVKHGATLIPPNRPTPFHRFFFRDPNGYVFEVVEANRAPET